MSTKRDLVKEAAAKAHNMQMEEIRTIKVAWDKFDLNGDGVVKTSEVEQFLSHLNINLPESQRARIISELDRNKSGTIEFVEFVISYEKGLFKNLQ